MSRYCHDCPDKMACATFGYCVNAEAGPAAGSLTPLAAIRERVENLRGQARVLKDSATRCTQFAVAARHSAQEDALTLVLQHIAEVESEAAEGNS